MCSFRLVCAVVLAASLAILPVSASFVMTNVAKTEHGVMSPSDDCPCCKAANVNSCVLKCCHVQALAIDELVLGEPEPAGFDFWSGAPLRAVSFRPDPPPPRS